MKKLFAILVFWGIMLFQTGGLAAVDPAGSASPGDPYSFIRFGGQYASGLSISGHYERVFSRVEDGFLLSGKKADLRNLSFSLAGRYDFGAENEAPIRRIRIDGLARQGARVVVRLFLDDEETPFAEKQLKTQSEKGKWDEEKPVFAEINRPIRGEHTLRFTVEDLSTPEGKKTEALIRSLKCYRETLPTVYVNIDESLGSIEAMNADPLHQTQCYGSIEIQVPEGYVCDYSEEGLEEYQGGTYRLESIRGRGESTWMEAKKPYKIKLDEKANLFGMGSSKHWALIANFFDRSFVRNRLTYRLGEAMGLQYTPRLVPVEVVINGDYQGLYCLSETIRLGESRVDIDDLEDFTEKDGDMTGGYLLSRRRKDETDGYPFETERSGGMLVVSPEEISDPEVPEETLRRMYDYIVGYYKSAEDAVFAPGGVDENGVHYSEYLDLDAMARYFLLQEFSMNRDAFRTDSTYLYKPRDGKLYWGPLWDFDLNAWGGDSLETYLADDEEAAQAAQGIYQQDAWSCVLRGDAAFVDAVQKAWGGTDSDDPRALRCQIMELIREGGVLDQYEAELSAAAEANADLPGYTFDYLDYYAGYVEGPVIDTDFHGEMFRLKRWIRDRLNWMDASMDSYLDENARIDLSFYSDGVLLEKRNAVNWENVFDFPVPAPQEGRYFAGWYAAKTGFDEETGEEIEIQKRYGDGSQFDEDVVFTAKWAAAEDTVLPEAIFMEQSEAYLRADRYIPISCTVMPEAADDTVFYTTSDASLAYVDQYDMLVIRETPGDVTITATTINGLSAEYLIHIVSGESQESCYVFDGQEISSDIWSFWVEETEISMRPGEYRKVEILSDPEYVLKPDYRILNAAEDVAFMTSEGVIVARGEGTAVIFIVNDHKDRAVRLTVTVKRG